MFTVSALGGLFCYLLFGPFLRESDRAEKALREKWRREGR